MKIEYPSVGSANGTQPTITTLLAANAAREEAIITCTGGGPFYVKRGTAASSTNYCFYLFQVGQALIINNYRGVITISPAPTAGQINVSEGVSVFLES